MTLFFYEQYPEKLVEKVEKTLLKYSGKYKKIAYKLIWWNLLFLFKRNKKFQSLFSDSYIHVAFDISGGVGDAVNQAYYIKAFKEYFGDKVVIDILSRKRDFEANSYIFNQLNCVENVIKNNSKNYDLLITLTRFPKVIYFNKNRLSNNLFKYVEYLDQFYKEKTVLFNNDYIGRYYCQSNGYTRKTQADIGGILNVKDVKLKFNSLENDLDVINKFHLPSQYITLQTGSGYHFDDVKNETRQWPVEYYNELCLLLKQTYPKYFIVQIGKIYQAKIKNVDIDLRGKTSFAELISILKCSKLHISQEGGMPILRSVLSEHKSVVLFGPTDEEFFGIKGNINISKRNCVGCCEWLTKDWMKKCIKTGKCAECMQNILPNYVIKKIQLNELL